MESYLEEMEIEKKSKCEPGVVMAEAIAYSAE